MAIPKVSNPIVADPVQTALDAFRAGQDPEIAAYGESSESSDAEYPDMSGDVFTNIAEGEGEEDKGEDISTEVEEPSESEQVKVSPETSDKPSPSKSKLSKQEELSTEKVFVRGEDGKRKPLEINYADRDAIKTAHLKAAGMEMYKRQRNEAREKIEKEYEPIKQSFEKLDTIFREQGTKGLVLQLAGEEGLKQLIEEEIRHREYLSSLSPSEKHAMAAKEQEAASAKRFAELEAKHQKMLADLEEKEREAREKSLEARIQPAFDRHRFHGKLGDAGVEHQLDSAIWMQVTKKLEAYPDSIELTPALIEREFRAASQSLSKVIAVQTDKKVGKVLDNKKVDAMQGMQLAAKKGISSSSEVEKFKKDVSSGDLMSAFKSVFSGKVKL